MRVLFVIIFSIVNFGLASSQAAAAEKETFSSKAPAQTILSARTEQTYSSKLYRMICDFSRQAPFTQGEDKGVCTMTLAENIEYIEANMPKPCDEPTRGKKLRAFIGSICDSPDQLVSMVQEQYFVRVETCSAPSDIAKYIGGTQKCLTQYLTVMPCSPHTHKDGTFHDCKNRWQGH